MDTEHDTDTEIPIYTIILHSNYQQPLRELYKNVFVQTKDPILFLHNNHNYMIHTLTIFSQD